jgi:hypothetical protein
VADSINEARGIDKPACFKPSLKFGKIKDLQYTVRLVFADTIIALLRADNERILKNGSAFIARCR